MRPSVLLFALLASCQGCEFPTEAERQPYLVVEVLGSFQDQRRAGEVKAVVEKRGVQGSMYYSEYTVLRFLDCRGCPVPGQFPVLKQGLR